MLRGHKLRYYTICVLLYAAYYPAVSPHAFHNTLVVSTLSEEQLTKASVTAAKANFVSLVANVYSTRDITILGELVTYVIVNVQSDVDTSPKLIKSILPTPVALAPPTVIQTCTGTDTGKVSSQQVVCGTQAEGNHKDSLTAQPPSRKQLLPQGTGLQASYVNVYPALKQ